MISETTHQQQEEPALSSIGKIIAMVRKGGLEPPRLSAPPPQDGVSANSTTSALKSISYKGFIVRLNICQASIAKQRCHTILAAIASNAIGTCTGFCTCILHSSLPEVKRNSARAGRCWFRDALFETTKPTLATDARKHQPFSTSGRIQRR